MRPVFVDANSLIVRNIMIRALEDLETDGVFTSGIFNSIRQLSSIVSQLGTKAGPVIAFFDKGIPEFRKRDLPNYKGERKKKRPQRLSEEHMEQAFSQIDSCREIFPTMGVHVASFDKTEADDCIGAAVKRQHDRNGKSFVVTSDHDLWRAVLFNAMVYDLTKQNLITYDTFEERTGVHPQAFALYKAILGDSSDDIEGVPGCGHARARDIANSVSHDTVDMQEQLDEAVLTARQKESPKKHETKLAENIAYLRTVLHCTDVFGYHVVTRKQIAREIKTARKETSVNERQFLQICRRYKFQSLIENSDRTLQPMKQVCKRVREKQK